MLQLPAMYVRYMMYTVVIIFMFASAHTEHLAYTCAFGFLLLFLYIGDLLHDVNVSLYNMLYLITSSEEESEE